MTLDIAQTSSPENYTNSINSNSPAKKHARNEQKLQPPSGRYKMSWGCQIPINSETKWPFRAEIILAPTATDEGTGVGCKCRESPFTDKELVVKYMYMIAYRSYYLKDPETNNACKVNDLLNAMAGHLELNTGNIWDQYPDCVPRSQDLNLRNCPAGVPFRDVAQMEDGTVVIFEGKTLGPRGRSLRDMLAEEEACQESAN